ncbi:hypothetical protein UQ64_11080 [Paenibacillus etheri]|uniref:Uncharacterized protein n=1 Tax=Paenibacillus etheri TaxID=1306852 RepID=A0A0W1B1C7_9BACL|nr:hypothetical protein UQ64_11080 [Paenibacillus etheri]
MIFLLVIYLTNYDYFVFCKPLIMIDTSNIPKHPPVIGETTRTPIIFLLELKSNFILVTAIATTTTDVQKITFCFVVTVGIVVTVSWCRYKELIIIQVSKSNPDTEKEC